MLLQQNSIDINVATITLVAENVIKVSYKTGVNIEIEDVKEIDIACQELSKNQHFYCLTIAIEIYSNMTNEAQKYLSHEAAVANRILGSAIVLSNLPIRILARFFIQFHKPKYPTKIFNSEKEAFKWFQKLKKE